MGFGGISIWALLLIIAILILLMSSGAIAKKAGYFICLPQRRELDIKGKSKMLNDESLYLDATNEFESNARDPALWAKCMSVCEGDEQKAKYKYINEKVKSLSRNNKKQVSQEAQRVRDENGKGFFNNLEAGNYSLAQTYWLYGVVVGFILAIPIIFITSAPLVGTYVLVVAIYQMAVLLGIWRSAKKYNGAKVWAVLAKLYAILGWLTLISSLILFIRS